MRILIADDDPFSVRLLRAHLQSLKHTVSTVDNGQAAVMALRTQGFDVAIIDWMMPELNGPEVCRILRSQSSERYVYLILLTARDSTQDVVAGLDSGADDYLTKPFSIAELEARLRAGQRILLLQENLIAAREHLRWQATHDALTGLLNRGALFETLQQHFQQAVDQQQSLAVLMCDVDHFKRLNDVYGHPVGDAALREVASRLARTLPQSGCIGRYGGEEFLVALTQVGGHEAQTAAEHVRMAIAESALSVARPPIHISVSLGVAVRDPTQDAAVCDLDELIRRADMSLLHAKRRGRNCSVIWPMGEPPPVAQPSI